MTQHTPGPWVAWKDHNTPWAIMPHDDSPAYITRHSCGIATLEEWPGSETEANARLIAAAPDLLAALEAICDQGYEDKPEVWAQAINAIAKATKQE